MLLYQTYEYWVCKCGTFNKLKWVDCSRCGKPKLGYQKVEVKNLK